MLNSKPLKDDNLKCCEDPEDYSIWDKIKYYFKVKVLYPPQDFYRWNKQRISRSLAYAKFGWDNWDWDFASVYSLLNFKLKRLYACLENGHAIQEEADMKALKEAIKVTHRLSRSDYDRKYHRAHGRKWGKLESKTVPTEYDKKGEPKMYEWISWRAGTKDASEEIKAQERNEFKACFEKGEADHQKDIDRLAYLLKNHASSWWD
jgi:hypothetical protein